MTPPAQTLVFGATGFVGAAVAAALEEAGHSVTAMPAPRLAPLSEAGARSFVQGSALVQELAGLMSGFDAVVNAAGNPDASERDERALIAVNGVLPGLLAAASAAAVGPPRFVHVSSAVVQGRAERLDDSATTERFSAYARSKILGERLTIEFAPDNAVIYRPPSVHAPDRRVTRMISRLANTPLATVAAPGDAPSPQALLPNVASAIAFLATSPAAPPAIVAHPSEGLTTTSVMEVLGGRRPRTIPRWAARAVGASLTSAGRLAPPLAANARRVELMWFGQGQAASWLTEAGWQPPAGLDEWRSLGLTVRGHNGNEGGMR